MLRLVGRRRGGPAGRRRQPRRSLEGIGKSHDDLNETIKLHNACSNLKQWGIVGPVDGAMTKRGQLGQQRMAFRNKVRMGKQIGHDRLTVGDHVRIDRQLADRGTYDAPMVAINIQRPDKLIEREIVERGR